MIDCLKCWKLWVQNSKIELSAPLALRLSSLRVFVTSHRLVAYLRIMQLEHGRLVSVGLSSESFTDTSFEVRLLLDFGLVKSLRVSLLLGSSVNVLALVLWAVYYASYYDLRRFLRPPQRFFKNQEAFSLSFTLASAMEEKGEWTQCLILIRIFFFVVLNSALNFPSLSRC